MSIVLLAPSAEGTFVPADTTSLREIEQEVARRVGPFQLLHVSNPMLGAPLETNSTTTSVAIPDLRSVLDLGGLEDMYVLRRGRLRDGTLLPHTNVDLSVIPFSTNDRLRLVSQYRPGDGAIDVDRPYAYAPNDHEEIELHHLNPEQELRPAVLAGLRRCYIVHRLPVSSTIPGPWEPVNLTDLAPWLLSRDQVYSVSMGGGAPLTGWRVEPYGGGLYLSGTNYAYGRAYVVNRRPATAAVLPASVSLVGPVLTTDWVVRAGNVNEGWSDEDRFAIPLDYAAAAGHIEAWRSARPRLTAVSQIGMWADQKEAAAEFTRVATVYFDPPRYDANLSLGTRRWLDDTFSNAP